MVDTLAAAIFDRLEGRALAVDLDPFEQPRTAVVVEPAQYPYRVFALDAKARMHQLVGQFARVGEQQQTFGIDVQAADRLPLAMLQARQTPEHGRALLRIVVRHHLADELVVGQHPRRPGHDPHLDHPAADADAVAKRDPLAGVGDLAIDLHLA